MGKRAAADLEPFSSLSFRRASRWKEKIKTQTQKGLKRSSVYADSSGRQAVARSLGGLARHEPRNVLAPISPFLHSTSGLSGLFGVG